jgi:hypothetical protein
VDSGTIRYGYHRLMPPTTVATGRRISHDALKSKNGLFRNRPSMMPRPLRGVRPQRCDQPPVEWPATSIWSWPSCSRMIRAASSSSGKVLGEAPAEVRGLVLAQAPAVLAEIDRVEVPAALE